MDLAVLPHQLEFLNSKKKYCAIVAGRGSGKSYVLALDLIVSALKYPKTIGCLLANTYSQLQKATIKTVTDLLTQMNIPYSYNQAKSILTINYKSEIHCLSVENYEVSGRGQNYGYIHMDEFCFYKFEAFQIFLATLRDSRGPLTVRMSSTPQGFNWCYDFLVKNIDNSTTELIQCSTHSNTFLPEEFIHSLEATYDPKLLAQELDGSFINLSSGRVYYSFDRAKHTTAVKPDTNDYRNQVYVGIDFNVNPLCAVICHYNNGVLSVFDEIYLENSNTFAAASIIKAKYPKAIVVPDATGKARKTSSITTDHQILRNAGLNVKVQSTNPSVKDRYNCVNNLIFRGNLIIHDKAVKTINDLEQLVYDNKDSSLSHISDALGYIAWYLSPLKAPQQESKNIINPFLNK
jgi:PBSX family phage terminase large subunit